MGRLATRTRGAFGHRPGENLLFPFLYLFVKNIRIKKGIKLSSI